MAQTIYPFIDLAVLDGVRQRFLAGDSVAILSTDLEDVIWANGAGAALLLGQPDIEAARGAASGLGSAARRQIASTRGFPAIGVDRPIAVRMAGGAIVFLASAIRLPGGEAAIMLALPASGGAKGEAGRIISGFAEAGHFAALIDDSGHALAANAGFSALGLGATELAALSNDVRHEPDRLAKRMVRAGDRLYPTGIARLSEDPARHLVIVIDDPRPVTVQAAPMAAAEPTGQQTPAQAKPARPASHDTDNWYFADALPQARAAAAAAAIARDEDASVIHAPSDDEPELPFEAGSDEADFEDYDFQHSSARDHFDEQPADMDHSHEAEAADVAPEGQSDAEDEAEAKAAADTESSVETTDAGEAEAQGDQEPSAAERDAATAGPGQAAGRKADMSEAEALARARPRFTANLESGPVRFVWKTDAQGCFSALSDEFPAAVGGAAADIIGRSFREVSLAFGLDPDGEIGGLLARRDTWSGRSVMWPLEGTGLKVPVDLAALPVYARDRSFEGFRGFGVVRISDAVNDPEAIGLSLAPPLPEAAPPEVAEATPPEAEAAPATTGAGDPFKGELPAISVDDTPERRLSDKVIRLAEHRSTPERTLSPIEKIAFREIGARLKKASGEQGEAGADAFEADSAPEGEQEQTPAGAADVADADAQAAEIRAREAELREAKRRQEQAGDTAAEQPAALPSKADEPVAADVEEPAAAPPPADEPEASPAQADEPEASPAEPISSLTEATEPQEPQEPDWTADVAQAKDTDLPETADFEAAYAMENAGGERSAYVDTSILARLPVPVLIHSGDDLHYANDEFLELTGYASTFDLAQAGGLDALFVDADETAGDPDDHRRRLRTRDGAEFPVEALLQSVPWHGRKALLLALKPEKPEAPDRAAAAGASPAELEELEARVAEMSTILDTATDGIIIIANDGTIRSISRPAEALFGFDTGMVAGKPFSSLFAVESQRAARDYLNGLSDHGVASVLNDGREVIGREAQGGFIPLFMTIGKLPSDNGYCAVLRDITHWKRAEEELTQARAEAERSSSQKTEFLARISHEIRTPLNAIIGFSELMIDEKFGPIVNDRYRDYLRDINRSGNHVLDLVNDLLDISKIEAGQQEMAYEAVSLNEALAEAVAMMQPQANRDRVIIRSSFASKLPEVVADLRSIRQIALNLLSNAVRYTQAGGQVIVSTAYEPAGDVVMRVRDTGIGMSQGEIEQALKPFKQINALKRPRGDGTGLGLPLTKAMVEANRARFSISSAPGEGTLVEISFPSTRVLAG